jgi:signal peptidase complex subunit 3
MNTIWVRLNAVFVYGLVVLGAMAFGCAMTTYWLDNPPANVDIKVNDLYHLLPFGRSGFQGERANFTFSVSADFRPVFNWNTRQVFVYITAEYETKYNTINQVVVWDRVLRIDAEKFVGGEWEHVWLPEKMLNLDNVGCKYLLMDPSDGLRSNDVKLVLNYDIMPISGTIRLFPKRNHDEFTMPKKHTRRVTSL